MQHDHPGGDASRCALCRDNQPFDLAEDLYKAVLKGRVVLFAGAGISTESNIVPVRSLVEDVCSDLSIDPSSAPNFPDLMSQFCAKSGGKAALLRKIKNYFDHIHSFRELERFATRFHQELGTIFLLEDIVTTNWDDYFERACGATPFVSAEDFTFWNLTGRKVLKIHGSVNAVSSIVATREDYERCYRELSTGLLWSSLKVFLATKTILYVGFSLRDDDFLRVHDLLSKEMKGLRPQSYIVTLDRSSDARFREIGVIPIYTDATFFLVELKKKLTIDGHMVADERFQGIGEFRERVRQEHSKVGALDLRKYPGAMYCLAYQDGLIHALDRIMTLQNTGYYSNSCNVTNTLVTYSKKIRAAKVRAKEYPNVAYVDGYIDGHSYLLESDYERRAFPTYYVFGQEGVLQNYDEFKKALAKAPKIHARAHTFAEKSIKRMGLAEGIGLHHPPIL